MWSLENITGVEDSEMWIEVANTACMPWMKNTHKILVENLKGSFGRYEEF
jgi:hypothetical protein